MRDGSGNKIRRRKNINMTYSVHYMAMEDKMLSGQMKRFHNLQSASYCCCTKGKSSIWFMEPAGDMMETRRQAKKSFFSMKLQFIFGILNS